MSRRSPKPPTPTPPAQDSGSADAKGRAARHDWNVIRREYISGDDSLTLKALSDKPGYPTYDSLKARSSREDWADLRADYRHQLGTKLRELAVDVKAEVRGTLDRMGDLLLGIGVRGAAHLKPEKMEPIDVARFAKIGSDLKAKAAGMDEVKIRLGRIKSPSDLDGLPDADLWALAGMLPPSDKDDDDF